MAIFQGDDGSMRRWRAEDPVDRPSGSRQLCSAVPAIHVRLLPFPFGNVECCNLLRGLLRRGRIAHDDLRDWWFSRERKMLPDIGTAVQCIGFVLLRSVQPS